MSSAGLPPQNRGFAAVRGLARRRAPVEYCEMCSKELALTHQHLIEPARRKLVCACDGCVVLFSSQGGTKFKRVPRRIRSLPDFRMTDGLWDSLMIPINMALFFRSSPEDRVVALYPSPAGPIESLLSLEAWGTLLEENPLLGTMEPDVEALLVNRLGQDRGYCTAEYYLLPIDECYRLVGLMRANWRGLSGGAVVWQEIGRFFGSLRERSGSTGERPSA